MLFYLSFWIKEKSVVTLAIRTHAIEMQNTQVSSPTASQYEDMPGLDTDIVVHRLPMKEGCSPIKQKVRCMRLEISEKIKAEVMKQFNACFLAVTSYPQWVANIVPLQKKDGKVHMCVYYMDLNRASPKDDFPLPHIDVLFDTTTQHNVFSFMDKF